MNEMTMHCTAGVQKERREKANKAARGNVQ